MKTQSFSKQPVTAFKLSEEAKQKLKDIFILICYHLKTMLFCGKKNGPKINLKFFKIPLFEWFKYRNVEHWPTDFLDEKT